MESAIRYSKPAQHYHRLTLVHTIGAGAVDAVVVAKVGIKPRDGNNSVELAERVDSTSYLRDASKDIRLPI